MSLIDAPTRPAPARASSLLLAPSVVGHRGSSGHRPEHTLAAYRHAIASGADEIELDLVPTADGVLIARHDAELSRTTDIAQRPEFAHRVGTALVDGETQRGWFVEGFTLAEIRTLRARERFAAMRPSSALHDDAEQVPTLAEVLHLAQAEGLRRGRPVGVLLELKHCARFAGMGLDVVDLLLDTLAGLGMDHPWSGVSVMSFEPGVLERLAGRTRLGLVQLIEAGIGGPADLWGTAGELTWAELASPRGLARIDEYADGLGVHKHLVLARDARGRLAGSTGLVGAAHRRGMTVHVWTLRAENRFLPTDLRRGTDPHVHGDLAAEVRAALDAGVDGVITDHPDVAVAALGRPRR